MKRILLGVILLIFGLNLSFAANKQPYHEYTLKNGLRLIVLVDKRAPVALTQVWYKVGSADEAVGRTGISHLFEHMMFKGTKQNPGDSFTKQIKDVGGKLNAFTTRDATTYYEMMPKKYLDLALRLEADRMRHLTITPKVYQTENKVVQNEYQERVGDQPIGELYQRVDAAAFIASPYHHPVIGWMSDVKQLTIPDLEQWYQRYYAPNNAIVVVAGDVNPGDVYAKVKQYFGGYKKSVLPEVKKFKSLPPVGEKTVVVNKGAQLKVLMMTYKVPVLNTLDKKDRSKVYALDVLAYMLGGMDSSVLPKRLVRDKLMAAFLAAMYDGRSRYDSLFMINAAPAKDVSIPELQQAIVEQVNQIKKKIDPKQLATVKNNLEAKYVYSQDSLTERASEYGRLASLGLPLSLAQDYVKKIDAVTVNDVKAVANEYLKTNNLTVGILQPIKK